MTYDPNNIFAKILRGEIPNRTVAENEHALAFEDINARAPVHVLVIPKGPYITSDEFAAKASAAEQTAFFALIGEVVRKTGIGPDGYRLIVNAGENAYQEVPHLHFHVLGGRRLGPMLSER